MSARVEAAADAVYGQNHGWQFNMTEAESVAEAALTAADSVMFSAERIALLTIELEHFRTSEEPPRVFARRITSALREGA